MDYSTKFPYNIANMKESTSSRIFSAILVLGGLIGLLFSVLITIEKLHLVQNPAYIPPCNINPLISCGSVMSTWQASVFGFPNSLIGIAGFSMMLVMGVALLAGASFRRWFWLLAQLGMTFAVGFVYWLFYQSVYRIGALCPYCMVVWAVTIPMFWYLTLYNLNEDHLPTPKRFTGVKMLLLRRHIRILCLLYLVIIGAILIHFWNFWSRLL